MQYPSISTMIGSGSRFAALAAVILLACATPKASASIATSDSLLHPRQATGADSPVDFDCNDFLSASTGQDYRDGGAMIGSDDDQTMAKKKKKAKKKAKKKTSRASKKK